MIRSVRWTSSVPLPASVWLFAGLVIMALGYLLTLGTPGILESVALLVAHAAYLGLLTWMTVRQTSPMPAAAVAPSTPRWLILLQLMVLVAVLIITGLPAQAPTIWSAMVATVAGWGDILLPADWVGDGGNALANPVQYALIPFLMLIILRAKPAELGLGPGWRVGRVCLIWLALPALILMVLVGLGLLPLQSLARRLLSNALQNGFFEEFLLRGALQTRLERLCSPTDALIIQALAFGMWHIEANTRMMDGNLLAGLAVCIASQAISGLCLGIVFRRTGNLIAPGVAHVALNALSQSFG
jgi:membrane protease YdiL (CAAX protease family)